MCSQMHGMVLTNERGEAASNCITWRDQRVMMPHPARAGSSYYQVLTERIPSQHVRQIGNELDPGRPICYLFWFAEQGKLAPGLVPVSLPDFVLSALCESEPGVEATNAGAYGALNLETLNWHEELIEELGLGDLRWPALRKTGEVAGYLSVNGARVPCYTPVGDYQCALVGALFDEEEVSLNIATGSQVSRMTPGLKLGDYQTRPFFDGRFLNTFSLSPGRAFPERARRSPLQLRQIPGHGRGGNVGSDCAGGGRGSGYGLGGGSEFLRHLAQRTGAGFRIYEETT